MSFRITEIQKCAIKEQFDQITQAMEKDEVTYDEAKTIMWGLLPVKLVLQNSILFKKFEINP